MDESRGTFIVIEGSDGSGKATQLKLIKERLEAAGYQVETFEFPRYDQPSSYFVKRYLDGAYGGTEDVGPYTSSLFYALDRFEAAPDIRQALKEGKVVLADRFTGSNMAHQGTKIVNAEQRRGFFIWLDNLEFEMLRIPRPDISFVLRVPADLSKKLLAERKKQDIHEADLTHLERTVGVFDDMTELFPKDFQRIDCVRSGKLLDIETISTMLWEKVRPLLPEPTAAKAAVKQTQPKAQPQVASQPVEEQKETPEPALPTPRELTLQNASTLLVQRVERFARSARVERPDIPVMYGPANLVPAAKKEYAAKINTLLGLYAKLVAGLGKHGIAAPEARRWAQQALPVAASSTVHMDPDDSGLETLITNLINDPLPEAQAAGASLFAQAIGLNPTRFRGANQPVKRASPVSVRSLAEEFLSENYIGNQPAVQLTSVWPRNENDLIADMLYEHSSLPLRTIQDRIATWPMTRKLSIFDAYAGDAHPGSALEKAHYSWDILCPYSVLLELQQLPSEALEIQTLTPRYGFDVPELVDEAGLSDTFEKCFDLSLELYSALQKAGHHNEAQYAVLSGHNQRFKLTQNAIQLLYAWRAAELSAEARAVLKRMSEIVAEVHPGIADTLTSKVQ